MTNTSVAQIQNGPYMSGASPIVSKNECVKNGQMEHRNRSSTSLVSTLNHWDDQAAQWSRKYDVNDNPPSSQQSDWHG